MLFVWGAVFEVWLSVLFCVSDDPLATSAGEDLVSVTESESGDCRSESFWSTSLWWMRVKRSVQRALFGYSGSNRRGCYSQRRQ